MFRADSLMVHRRCIPGASKTTFDDAHLVRPQQI